MNKKVEWQEVLTLLRKKNEEYTQYELAVAVGFTPTTIYRWLNGLAQPKNSNVKQMILNSLRGLK